MRPFLILLALLSCLITDDARAQVYGTPIVSWDFSEGIPSGWINQSEDGISAWEYRGPSTDPDVTVASQGSCGASSIPINAPSAENGFVIFDSNYWDDPIGPCGNLGSGEAAAPHHAWLITEAVDLSEEESVVLTFRQQYRHFNATTKVELSTDGETWTEIHVNPTSQASQSPPGVWVSVNISELVSGATSVQLKFDFSGTYYHWMLDDITLYTPSDNDLIIDQEAFTLFNGNLEPNGFGDMEYGGYPTIMLPPLNFSARLTNVGALEQEEVNMNVRITNSAQEFVFNENTENASLAAGANYTASFEDPYIPPAQVDLYTIRFKAQLTEVDQTPLNNEVFKSFAVTDYSYQTDLGPMEDVFIPSGIYENEANEIGNAYQMRGSGLRLHSIGVGLAEPTLPGTEIYGVVYNASRDSILGQTDPYFVNEWDLNEVGSERIIHLQLQEDILTMNDSLYLIMVGSPSGGEQGVFVGRNGSAIPQASLIAYPNINGLFYFLKKPMVRAHLFPGNTVPGCLDPEAMNFEPEADTDDGSCRYPGCTAEAANNYDPLANFEDGSCIFVGCTDPEAANYDPNATEDDGSCLYPGCTDPNAENFDPEANSNDGSCIYSQAFLSANDTTGCAPHTVLFTNQTSLAEDGECTFFLGEEVVSNECLESFELTFDTPGEYFVTYAYSVSGNASSYTLGPIVVFENPATPEISYDQESNLLSCSNCNGDLTWFINGSEVQGQNASTWSPLDNGEYSVSVLSEEGCESTSDPLLVIITSVGEIGMSEVWIYPNPARDKVNLRSPHPIEHIRLLDMQGRTVRELTHPAGQAEITLESIAPGNYLLLLYMHGTWSRERLVIAR